MPIDNDSSHDVQTNKPEPQPLPEGYLPRLWCMLALTIGGVICILFFSALVGSLMTLAGVVFAKMSGLNDMVSAAKPKRSDDAP